MGEDDRQQSGAEVAELLQQAAALGEQQADPEEVAATDRRLEALLEQMGPMSAAPFEQEAVEPKADARPAADLLTGVAMRTARPVELVGQIVRLRVRGADGDIDGELAPGVDREVISDAITNSDAVMVECVAGEAPLVVGVLQTRVPKQLNLRGGKVVIEGEQEVLLRSGRAAMRMRGDGDVELVGSRIATMSRGLFRIVGRVLRLN